MYPLTRAPNLAAGAGLQFDKEDAGNIPVTLGLATIFFIPALGWTPSLWCIFCWPAFALIPHIWLLLVARLFALMLSLRLQLGPETEANHDF